MANVQGKIVRVYPTMHLQGYPRLQSVFSCSVTVVVLFFFPWNRTGLGRGKGSVGTPYNSL